MKKKKIKYFVLVVLFLLSGFTAHSKNHFEISLGIGYMDGINAKLKYGNNLQIGVSQFLFYNSSALEVYYHFAGKSEYSDQRLWYCMAGNNWNWQIPSIGITDKSSYPFLYFRVGRTFNLSTKIGMSFELGLGNEYEQLKDIFNPANILPTINFGFFYRL
jgi:hypothetical protein